MSGFRSQPIASATSVLGILRISMQQVCAAPALWQDVIPRFARRMSRPLRPRSEQTFADVAAVRHVDFRLG